MNFTQLFRREGHRWLAFGQDATRPEGVVDTNHYVVAAGNAAMLIDPGGVEVFPQVIGALAKEVAMEDVRQIFLSHQDPDVGSALPLWRRVCRDDVRVQVPALWTGFISHFDKAATLVGIPDEGAEITVGNIRLKALPAHYLPSPGQLCLYDPAAKVLYSADIGSSLVPPGMRRGMVVEDFADQVSYLEAFHRRHMGSPAARDAWLNMVATLEIEVLAPQHGPILKGDAVKRFLDWFRALDIGSGLAAYAGARR